MFKLQQQKKDDDNISSDEDSIAPDTNKKVLDGVQVTAENDSVGEGIVDNDLTNDEDKDATNDEDKDDNAEIVANNDDSQ